MASSPDDLSSNPRLAVFGSYSRQGAGLAALIMLISLDRVSAWVVMLIITREIAVSA